MLTVTDQLRIRQAYYHEKKSQREIARELGLSRNTVKKAIEHDEPFEYRRQQPAHAPVIGPYRERLREMVETNRELETNTRIRVNSLDPGPVATAMRNLAYPGENPEHLARPDDVVLPYLYLLGPDSAGINGQQFDIQ